MGKEACPGCGVNPGFRHYRGCSQSGGPFDDKPYEPAFTRFTTIKNLRTGDNRDESSTDTK